MKSLIIDDERLARKELIRLLEPYKEIEITAEASNVDEALDLIGTLSPELLFLDINMPGKSGFDLLESLDRSPKVIFTTAYDEHAVKAFDYNALDYLMKPIAPERLAEAVKKVLEKTQKEHPSLLGPILTGEDQVFVKDGDNCWFVKLAEVRLFESVGNYVRLYFEENKPMILKSLNALDEKLDQKTFFRASRKHIVNLQWIEKIEPWFSGGLMVTLKGGEKVEVSRRQAARFRDQLSL